MGNGNVGANTGSVITSPAKARRIAKAKRAQERKWAAKCGPVTTRFVDPATLKRP